MLICRAETKLLDNGSLENQIQRTDTCRLSFYFLKQANLSHVFSYSKDVAFDLCSNWLCFCSLSRQLWSLGSDDSLGKHTGRNLPKGSWVGRGTPGFSWEMTR